MTLTHSPPEYRAPWWRILWHPYQRLWNWRLVGAVRSAFPDSLLGRLAVKSIILLDTLLLGLRALARRVSRTGFRSLIGTPRVPPDIPVLYFDLGTHRKARELSFMVYKVLPTVCDRFTAYGFEAFRPFWEEAREQFTDRPDVRLINGALCHFAMPLSGTIKLYKVQADGLGASIYREGEAEYEEVAAMRFSDWLRDNDMTLRTSICLLRMNIEGAEFDVIQDLVDHGLAEFIDGYYGMWDDTSKIDPRRGEELRALLTANKIAPFTFNGRDLRFAARKQCIAYDVFTSIQAGARRIRAAGLPGARD